MSSVCSQVLGSKIKMSLVKNLDCGDTAPLQQLVVTVVAAANAEQITIGLDPAFTVNSVVQYTANSIQPLYARTKLFVGGQYVEIVSPRVLLTTTPVVVKVAPLELPIAVNAVINTRLGAIPCTSDVNVAAPPQTATNSTNCNGNLLTDVNTGYKRTCTIMGFPDGKDATFWDLMLGVGEDLASVYYYIDYDGQYGETGVMQLSFPDFQQGSVAQIQKYQISGQVQNYKMVKASVVNTAAQQVLINAERALWGFKPAK
jgi:hypothetical protein